VFYTGSLFLDPFTVLLQPCLRIRNNFPRNVLSNYSCNLPTSVPMEIQTRLILIIYSFIDSYMSTIFYMK
jgi:hypothetical protein